MYHWVTDEVTGRRCSLGGQRRRGAHSCGRRRGRGLRLCLLLCIRGEHVAACTSAIGTCLWRAKGLRNWTVFLSGCLCILTQGEHTEQLWWSVYGDTCTGGDGASLLDPGRRSVTLLEITLFALYSSNGPG